MKKKLAAIDMRLQIAGVVLGLVLVTFLLHMFIVSPQSAKATKIQSDIDAVDAQIAQRRLDLKKSGTPPTIEVADLFKLSRAMPDQADMPGIILTLSEVAREAGISFDLIEPAQTADATAPVATTGYQAQRMHLVFNGDFYGLSDFLYRLRSLVVVHDGKLAASGRLFNASSVSFKVSQDKFPKISAELYVDAYVYAPAPPAAPTPAPSADGTTTTTTTTSTDSTTTTPAPAATAPTGATAAGATN